MGEMPKVWTRQLSADELRSKFLDFFRERGHAIIPSASLIPENDPSVLFTTAGMHPLVPYLMGREHPKGARLADSQKCVRTNDLEEVGDDTHLTFFEMLGNWSLGDYFKKESIAWSFEFLTGADYLAIPEERIWVTCFEGNEDAPRDEEAAAIWRAIGMPEERITFLGAEDNWWATGPTGPCGPDTEIFFDRTQEPCGHEAGCAPGICECERFVEIWNNVFMEYNRTVEGIHALPKQNVDTGMGLERALAVMNGVPSVYETTSFSPIVDHLVSKTPHTKEAVYGDDKLLFAIRVVSDHLRTSCFIIGDERGVGPSNAGQGYVLRRLIRRAVRYCEDLQLNADDWVGAHEVVIERYGDAYPELRQNAERIRTELTNEVARFRKTLATGSRLLEGEIAKVKGAGGATLAGDVAFRLYDTYGFPVEFTQELAGKEGIEVDMEGFQAADAAHREVSKSEAAKSGLADTSEESTRYHTATHLLHAALREKLGDHVMQKGSNITSERMRFDFNFERAMTPEEKAAVEARVQEWIDAGIPVENMTMDADEAREAGAIGLFTDKYDDIVSIYRIGDVSMEFCGGPHVANTAEIGRFKIKKEQSSSAGVRRIRAVIE